MILWIIFFVTIIFICMTLGRLVYVLFSDPIYPLFHFNTVPVQAEER